MADTPVRVVFDERRSAALRYLFQHLEPTPTLTGLVSSAVDRLIREEAEREGSRAPQFREAARRLEREWWLRPTLTVVP